MISVITPVYNGENFIAACIKTVIAQGVSDLEHIIVDGNSKDKTVEIVQQYAQKYPHIRWLSEGDRGQSDAMNKGIALAKGEIIALLNVDDYYEPNVLSRVAQAFKSLPEPSLLVGNCKVIDEQGQVIYTNRPAKLKFQDLLLGFEINPHPVNPAAYFYHKSLHDKVGWYDTAENFMMDLDFLLRAVQVANLKYVNETWGNFRYLEGTKTASSHKEGIANQKRSEIVRKYCKQLPWTAQMLVFAQKYYVEYVWSKVKYFYKYPWELFPSVIKKLEPFSGITQ